LIHGIGASADWWLPNFADFAPHFTIYAADLPGSGSSYPLKDSDLAEPETFIVELLDVLGIPSAPVVGHSMGGYVALRFAARYPDRVDNLVLVDNAGFGRLTHPLLRLMVFPGVGEVLISLGEMATRFFVRTLFYDPRKIPDDLVAIAARYSGDRRFRRAFLRILRSGIGLSGAWKRDPAVHLLQSVACPTLILWGAEDPVFCVEQVRPLARRSDVHLSVFERAGHAPQLEHTARFADAVLAKVAT
jgi:pimeloyl-ACP methyl ester carboxylesterase